MDRITGQLPDPIAGIPLAERRRLVRQKIHTPVYASFKGPQSGMVVDLSELLDLHEDGFAVQTAERLEVNRAVSLCLDLPETNSYIHTGGKVIWSDDTGRSGICFSAMSDASRRVLRDWLFTNLLVAGVNHRFRAAQRARHEIDHSAAVSPLLPVPDVVGVGYSVEPLAEIPSESRPESPTGEGIGAGANSLHGHGTADTSVAPGILQLVSERACEFTGASGAALALVEGGRMICRARAGEPAPMIGAPVDIKKGISGECVRSGSIVMCNDTLNDRRVDAELCRALGIGSIMAVPIFADYRVVGLLEIFSPATNAFRDEEGGILERLIESIPKPSIPKPYSETVNQQPKPMPSAKAPEQPRSAVNESNWQERKVVEEPPSELLQPEMAEAATASAPSRLLYRALLGLVIAVLILVLGYLAGPPLKKRWSQSVQASPQRASENTVAAADRVSSADQASRSSALRDLQNLAASGDAEAQWQLGVRYHNGEGVPRDDTEAIRWFQSAAEQGNVAAESALGAYYWAGRGVPEDLSKAYFWSAIALAQGDENSKNRMEGLASQMTQAQVSAARQQAEAWIQSHTQRAKSGAN